MPNAYDKFFKGQWTNNRKWDPLTHRALELIVHQDAHNVGAIDHGISKMFGGDGSTVLGDESRKVEKDPVRGIGRAALTAGAIFGAGAAMGGGAGAGGGGAAAGGGGAAAGGGAMGMGEIGASGMTPALMESAVGTSGYGLSSAGLGYMGGAGAGAGGVAAYNTGASNPALIDSAMGTSGYGASSAGPGGAGGAAAGTNWQDQQMPSENSSGSGEQQQRRYDEAPVYDAGTVAKRLAALQAPDAPDVVITSSKEKKGPPRLGRMAGVIERGASGEDPYSTNGVEIGALKALAAKLDDLEQRAKRRGITV